MIKIELEKSDKISKWAKKINRQKRFETELESENIDTDSECSSDVDDDYEDCGEGDFRTSRVEREGYET
jgi:hypothetical protein